MKLFQPRRVDDDLHGITFGEFVEATPADAIEVFGRAALIAELFTPEAPDLIDRAIALASASPRALLVEALTEPCPRFARCECLRRSPQAST